MAAMDGILRCTVGTAGFQLADYGYKEAPQEKNGQRIGTKVEISGEGWIEAATGQQLADAIAAARSSWRLSGQDVKIYGPGGMLEYELLASACVNAGPHISFEKLPAQTDALCQEFRFTVTAQTAEDGSGGGGGGDPVYPLTYVETVQRRPDGLHQVTRRGQTRGGGAKARAQAAFGDFEAAYPASGWVLWWEVGANDRDDEGSFNFTAQELLEPLPVGATAGQAVDGEAVLRWGRDEQMRLVKVWDYDLTISGDWQQVLDAIRPTGEGLVILRESGEVTRYREIRLRASFETLEGGNGNPLMNWSQSFRFVYGDGTVYEERRYPGVSPVLVQQPVGFRRLVQSGSASGAGLYPKPPAPLFPDQLIEPADVQYASANGVEKTTSWSYTMALGAGDEAYPEDLERPDVPEFVGGSA